MYKISHKYCYLSFFLISILFVNSANAQGVQAGDKVVNEQVWIDFYPHFYLNDKVEYYGDSGYRSMVSGNNGWQRIYIRPSIKYHQSKTWEFQAGLGLFYIFQKELSDKFEITPWQGVQLMWPRFNILHFKHLVKLEERFSYNVNDNWSSSTEFRLRYKLSGKIDFTDNWFVPFYGEFFVPVLGEVEELFRNKGRVGVGLGYRAKKDWQLSFVFNWQGSRDGIEQDLNISDYAFQLKYKKVWQSIFLKNKRKKEERMKERFDTLEKL